MLYTIAVVLLVMWVLGLATSYTLGGFIHVLLVIAIIAVYFMIRSKGHQQEERPQEDYE